MSDLFQINPEALWLGVVSLCILVLVAMTPLGRSVIARARRASTPRLLACFAVSLALTLIGWVLVIANMEVLHPRAISQFLMYTVLPGIWIAMLLEPHGFVFTGVPFIILVSTALWTVLLYLIWTLLAHWRRRRRVAA